MEKYIKVLTVYLKTVSYNFYIDYERSVIYMEHFKKGELVATRIIAANNPDLWIIYFLKNKKTIQKIEIFDEDFLYDLTDNSHLYSYDIIAQINRIWDLATFNVHGKLLNVDQKWEYDHGYLEI